MKTNRDREGRIFLSHMNNVFYFLLIIKYCIFIFEKKMKKASGLGQYCLPMSHKKNDMLILVKEPLHQCEISTKISGTLSRFFK